MRWLVTLALVGSVACSASTDRDVLVFAAASLRVPMTDLAADFTHARPVFNFGGSDALARAIATADGADVFASADVELFDGLQGFEPARIFARNELAIVVPDGNPAAIRSLADLARPGIVLVLAGEQVPAGAYARQALRRADASRALDAVVSNELDVAGVIGKVAQGEADAGIAYRTDAVAGVDLVPIPVEQNVQAAYGIAARSDSALGRAFVEHVLLSTDVFIRRGFIAP